MSETLFDRNYNTLISDRVDWSNNIHGRSGNLKFYTDGSKLDGKVGYELYCKELDVNLSRRLPDTCSVYQAEILANRDVAEWLRRNVVANTGVNIYSNSQAAIRSMESVALNLRTAQDCRSSLSSLTFTFFGCQGMGHPREL